MNLRMTQAGTAKPLGLDTLLERLVGLENPGDQVFSDTLVSQFLQQLPGVLIQFIGGEPHPESELSVILE